MFLSFSFVLMSIFVILVLDNKELFDATYKLRVDFEVGLGLKPGTEVQINGVQVGKVKSIMLRDDRRVELSLEIKEEFKNFITSESVAYPTRAQNIISDRIIFINPGTTGKVLQNHQFIKSEDPKDIESLLSQTTELLEKVEFLVYAGDTLIKMAQNPNSTVGALLHSKELHDNLLNQTKMLGQITSQSMVLLDTINEYAPTLFHKVDTIQNTVIRLSDKGQSTIAKVDTLLDFSLDMARVAGPMIYDAKDLLDESTNKLEDAGHLINELNSMWFLDDAPTHETTPYLTEQQW